MPIQAPKQEGGGGEAWLATYGDMVTLLLTFFVMMYALLMNASASASEETTQARIEFFQQLQQGMSRASMMPDTSPMIKPLPQTGQDLLNRQYVDFVATQTVNADIETFEDRIRITLPGDVLFVSGEASIREAAYEDLNSIADALVQYPGLVYVSGHTDSDPFDPGNESPYRDNWGLSAARAANVVRYLEDQGVPRADLRAVACADTVPRPAGARRGEAYKAYQRRVELTVIPGGDPFGGGYAELGQDRIPDATAADAQSLLQGALDVDIEPLPVLETQPLEDAGEEGVLRGMPEAGATGADTAATPEAGATPPRPPGAVDEPVDGP